MKLKVCYNNEIHRLSQVPDTLETLLELVNSIFHSELPQTWTLQYTDTDGDNICLTTEKDYEEFMSSEYMGGSIAKVHVVPVTGLKQPVPPVEEVIVVENDNREDEEYHVIQRQEQHSATKPNESVDLDEESFESREDEPEEPVREKRPEPVDNKICIDLETLEKLVSSMVEKSLVRLTEASQQLMEKPKNAVEFQNMLSDDDSILSELEKPQVMKVKHAGVRCDGCGVMPIMGIRYKCQTCAEYDLCEKCEDEGQHSHHNFVKMKKSDACESDDIFGSFMPARCGRKSDDIEDEIEAPVEKKNLYVGEEEPSEEHEQEYEEEYEYEESEEGQCEDKNVEEPVPEAEEIAYYDKLMEKVIKMLKVFPNEKFHVLAAFVNEAPDDLDLEELVENFRH